MEIKTQILNKIKEYDRIVITRHIRPDGDCIGASMGLRSIIKCSFPNKEVYSVGEDTSEYTSFISTEDENREEIYKDSLVIVVDTATFDRISNKKEYLSQAKEIIKIDHHIPVDDYGTVNLVRTDLPACCSIIADLLYSFDELKIDDYGASCLFFGIVTDTGRFRYRGVGPELLTLTAKLLEHNVDMENIYAHLYTKDKSVLKLQGYVYDNFKTTESGVNYIYFSLKTQKKYKVTTEEASSLVNTLDCIKGGMIWMIFVEQPTKEIRVRLRSRFVAINELANKYHGGGHQQACGATVYSKKEMKALVDDADKVLKEYKNSHPEAF